MILIPSSRRWEKGLIYMYRFPDVGKMMLLVINNKNLKYYFLIDDVAPINLWLFIEMANKLPARC